MRRFNSVNVRNLFTTRPAFQASQKDVLPLLQQNKTVYKFHIALIPWETYESNYSPSSYG